MASLTADLELLTKAGQAAGDLAMRFFRQSPAVRSKHGGALVTDADTAVDTFLRAALLAERPDYGWLSEESVDVPAERLRDNVFVIDPIDGTRGFIEGDDRWCVSLAVVRDGRPVVGMLFAPARGEAFRAVAGEGAWSGDLRLSASTAAALRDASLAGPRGWLKTAAIRDTGAALEGHVPSLAYRFAMVATGRFDAAFASPNANDWDLAAADLLVHEAGGRLTELDGSVPRYNRPVPRHGALAAAGEALHPALLVAVQAAAQDVARGGSRAPASGKPE